MKIKVPVKEPSTDNVTTKSCFDQETSSLIEDIKVECGEVKLTSKTFDKKTIKGLGFVVWLITLVLSLTSAITLLIFQYIYWKPNSALLQEPMHEDLDYSDIDRDYLNLEDAMLNNTDDLICREDCEIMGRKHQDCKLWYIQANEKECFIYSKCQLVNDGVEFKNIEITNKKKSPSDLAFIILKNAP